MAFQTNCTVKHLAEVLGRCQEESIGEWRS